jgi:hypothetical protein
MNQGPAQLGIQLDVRPEADPEEVADAALRLRRELLDLDVEAVEMPATGELPPGARGAVDRTALGALVVTVATAQMLGPIVAAIRSWLAGSPQRSIKLELDGDVLELTELSSEDQRRLADEWVRRHTSP